MKHSVSTSMCDDCGVAAPSPACWGFGGLHHFSVTQFPFQTTPTLWTSFGMEHSWKTTIYWWKAPIQFIINLFYFFLQVSHCWLQGRESCFHTCKSSYLRALVLPELRWNHTQPTHRGEPARRVGGKTVGPFPSLRPPQGTGSPTCPRSTASPTIFEDLGGVGTQLLVREPSFP